MVRNKKQECPGQGLEMWANYLQGNRPTQAEIDHDIEEALLQARKDNNQELVRQINLFRQEVTGVREQFIAYRRDIANLMNELKKDVSDRLLNFTSYGEWLTYKEELNARFSAIEERLGE